MTTDQPSWVFAYGSLIWKHDFEFIATSPASISGWKRRFWQGSHDHRGTQRSPGRVVTLVEAPGEICHGLAIQVDFGVFAHLDFREKNGYQRVPVDIQVENRRVKGVTYFASQSNHAFLGQAPLNQIARHIDRSSGPSGSNREYLFSLARALRDLGVEDPHVFALEALLSG